MKRKLKLHELFTGRRVFAVVGSTIMECKVVAPLRPVVHYDLTPTKSYVVRAAILQGGDMPLEATKDLLGAIDIYSTLSAAEMGSANYDIARLDKAEFAILKDLTHFETGRRYISMDTHLIHRTKSTLSAGEYLDAIGR